MRGFGAEVDRAICPSTVTGHSSAVGCVRIGAFPKRNSRSTWGSSSSCTTSASEAKRCFLRSLSCWSCKTLESNKSVDEALVGFQGRGCTDVVQPNCCHPFLLEALLFQWSKYGGALLGPCWSSFSDHVGAYDPGIQ